MKKIMTSAIAFLLLLSTSSAQAWYQQDSCYDPCVSCEPCCSDSWYVGVFAGANWLNGKKHHHGCFSGKRTYQTGYAVGASIGRSFCDDFNVEFEYTYRNNQFKNRIACDVCAPRHGHAWSNSYMVNGLWNISMCNDWCLRPFVGGGIGYATHHLEFNHRNISICDKRNDKKNGFAWQVIAGLGYEFCDNIDLSLQYRFYQGGFKNLYSQNVGAGLRYKF